MLSSPWQPRWTGQVAHAPCLTSSWTRACHEAWGSGQASALSAWQVHLLSTWSALKDVQFLTFCPSCTRTHGMHTCSFAIWITHILGMVASLSVTGLIHKLAQSFNALKALRATRGGRNWPRIDYLAADAASELRRVLRTEGPLVLLQQLLESSEVDLEAVCSRLRDLMWTHPGYRHLAI